MSESIGFREIPTEEIRIPGDTNLYQITPHFRFESIENIPASERSGQPVYETREVVELRFAGDRHYKPVFPVDAMYERQGLRVITFAEKWAPQYRAFLAGEGQQAEGTPLENLKPYGITPAQISLCRALNIHTVEALHGLEGKNLKSLGPMHTNVLKPMAKKFMDTLAAVSDSSSEVEALKERIRQLEGAAKPADVVESAVAVSDDDPRTNDELKAAIVEITGKLPRGNPSRATLIASLRELRGE